MEIGKEEEAITVEPIEDPFARPAPSKEPAPQREVEVEREKVPA